jgi:hypothetical protein
MTPTANPTAHPTHDDTTSPASTRTSGRFGKALAVGLATLAAATAFAAPTVAHADDGALGPRLERACLRVPNLEIRTASLIERLEGDAGVLGSLAWLQAQIDRATNQGRTQLADVLTNRLAVRTTTLELLHQRQERLPELRQFCIDHGVAL